MQNFHHHYSSLQCHMIFQKSFYYADVLKKNILLFCLDFYWTTSLDYLKVQKNSIY